MGTGDDAESLLRLLLKPEFMVSLSGNPWECPPAAVVAAGLLSIRGYYRELEGCATGPMKMQSLKVVLAGHSGAGKTRYAQIVYLYFSHVAADGPSLAHNTAIECQGNRANHGANGRPRP